jgi:hypothetical protein
MKGTTHEKDWVFYHNALSLMTAHETVEWMKNAFGENGESYYSRWVLPENELHSDDPALKAYLFRPVGNSSENLRWDTFLNQDVKAGVEKHVTMTHDLNESDPRKFSLSTPQRGSSAFIQASLGIGPFK